MNSNKNKTKVFLSQYFYILIHFQLKQLKEERTKNENECERLNKLLDESIKTLKQLEKETRQLESSNTKLDNVLLQAERDHANLVEEMKNR